MLRKSQSLCYLNLNFPKPTSPINCSTPSTTPMGHICRCELQQSNAPANFQVSDDIQILRKEITELGQKLDRLTSLVQTCLPSAGAAEQAIALSKTFIKDAAVELKDAETRASRLIFWGTFDSQTDCRTKASAILSNTLTPHQLELSHFEWMRSKAGAKRVGLLITLPTPSAVTTVLSNASLLKSSSTELHGISKDKSPKERTKVGNRNTPKKTPANLEKAATYPDPKLLKNPVVVLEPINMEPTRWNATSDCFHHSLESHPTLLNQSSPDSSFVSAVEAQESKQSHAHRHISSTPRDTQVFRRKSYPHSQHKRTTVQTYSDKHTGVLGAPIFNQRNFRHSTVFGKPPENHRRNHWSSTPTYKTNPVKPNPSSKKAPLKRGTTFPKTDPTPKKATLPRKEYPPIPPNLTAWDLFVTLLQGTNLQSNCLLKTPVGINKRSDYHCPTASRTVQKQWYTSTRN